MKLQHVLLVSIIMLCLLLTNCSELTPEDTKVIPDITIPDLSNGISHLLNKEELALFTTEELNELDVLAKTPKEVLNFRAGQTVTVAAESDDMLAAAIAQAGEGGTVILEAGMHRESATVIVDTKVQIIGEPGAILVSDTKPFEIAGFVQAALYILNTNGVSISGLVIKPKENLGGTAILVHNSSNTRIIRTTLDNNQFGIIIENGDRTRIAYNTIVTNLGWTTGDLSQAHGVISVNGKGTRMIGNEIFGSLFGVFATGNNGFYIGNKTSQNLYGLVLCKVPEQAIPLPGGILTGSKFAANKWMVLLNSSFENFDSGYLVIDGANNNILINNKGANNANYDIELTGDTPRFGFLAPTSFENTVLTRPGMIIKDCGVDNRIRGKELVDTSADPCF